MTEPARKQYYTVAEYLAREEVADFRSEYYQGEIFAMAGESLNHNRVAIDLCAKLNQAIRQRGCEAFAENVRVRAEAVDLFAYPDVVVVCGAPQLYQDREDTITNPLLIIEVLSKSTKNYDRGDKFNFYRMLPTVKEYVLIEQYRIHVEQFSPSKAGIRVTAEYRAAEDVLKFSSIDFQITLKELYARVKFKY